MGKVGAESGVLDYCYGFNGKEKDQNGEFGSITNYDYGFRIYNPAIGRFLSVDPLTASYPSWSPYPFAMNRPIDGVDLDGAEWEDVKGAFTWAARQTADLVVETAQGVLYLATNPSAGAHKIAEGLAQTASDIGIVYGTAADIAISTATDGEIEIDQDAFDESTQRLSKGIVKSGVIHGISLGSAQLIKKAIPSVVYTGPVLPEPVTMGWNPFKKRPYLKKSTIDKAFEQNKGPDGKVRDPKTKKIIKKDAKVKVVTKSGRTYNQRAWDMGHKPGKEWKKELNAFEKGKLTKEQLKARYNDPSRYRPETRKTNRGGSLEKKDD